MEGRIQCDYCVVGAGMIGSAAAKHLQVLNPSSRVVLVGPSEPKSYYDTDIYGAHYDEGRITRELSVDPVREVLFRAAIASYTNITQKSGLEFYSPCGWLYFSNAGETLLQEYKNKCGKFPETSLILDREELTQKYPYLNVPPDTGAILVQQAGCINPRVLLRAQQQIATKHGCQIIDDVVDSIHQEPSGHHILITNSGKQISTQKVLLATGAFTECRNLLPEGVSPAMNSTTETVLFVEILDKNLEGLKNMPCMGSSIKLSSGTMGYILPPIKYPDGKYYIKIGHYRDYNVPLRPSEIASWFRGDDHPHREKTKHHLTSIFQEIFPGVPMVNYHFDYCSTVSTRTNYPFIDMLNSSFGVAIGGCGTAASCSDEIGKIAARMVTKGGWDYHLLHQDNFKFRSKVTAKL